MPSWRPTAQHFDIDRHDLLGKRRDARTAGVRQVAMYLMRNDGRETLPEIGRRAWRPRSHHGAARLQQDRASPEARGSTQSRYRGHPRAPRGLAGPAAAWITGTLLWITMPRCGYSSESARLHFVDDQALRRLFGRSAHDIPQPGVRPRTTWPQPATGGRPRVFRVFPHTSRHVYGFGESLYLPLPIRGRNIHVQRDSTNTRARLPGKPKTLGRNREIAAPTMDRQVGTP